MADHIPTPEYLVKNRLGILADRLYKALADMAERIGGNDEQYVSDTLDAIERRWYLWWERQNVLPR